MKKIIRYLAIPISLLLAPGLSTLNVNAAEKPIVIAHNGGGHHGGGHHGWGHHGHGGWGHHGWRHHGHDGWRHHGHGWGQGKHCRWHHHHKWICKGYSRCYWHHGQKHCVHRCNWYPVKYYKCWG